VTSVEEGLKKTAKARAAFELTRCERGYHHNGSFIPFKSHEQFHLMKGDHNTQWVVLVDNHVLVRLDAHAGRLHREEGGRGTIVMSWERESAIASEQIVVPVVMDEDWYRSPELEFKNAEQYTAFIKGHGEAAAAALNRLYTAYEADDKTRRSMDLALVVDGPHKGQLGLIKQAGSHVIRYEDGEVIEQEGLQSDDLELAIRFKLHFGQHRPWLPIMRGYRVVRDTPKTETGILCNGREWIPQLNQMVMVDGLEDIYLLDQYSQSRGKFMLILADPQRRHEDMVENNATKPRAFYVTTTRLRPVIVSY